MTFAELEQKVTARARELELGPLLRVLRELGYGRDDLLFESSPETASPAGPVEAVHFEPGPPRRARITLNLGLLGPDPLLPSYFFAVAERSPRPEAFYDFIRFFDHPLIERFLDATAEGGHADGADVGRTRTHYLKMLGLGSVSTLHWLFALYFPELRVFVRRQAFRTSTAIHALRTGISRLDGSSVVGRVYAADTAGFAVELFAEEEADDCGRAWPHVARERLASPLLPLLASARLPLRVGLTVASHASWARLTAQSYLGYERVRGDAESSHRMILFEGDTSTASAPQLQTRRAEGRAAS